MNHIMEWVQWGLAFSKQNPLIAGGIGLWGVTVLTMLARQIPNRIAQFLKEQFTVTLTVRSGEGKVFEPVLHWFESQPACKRFRTLTAQSQRHLPVDDDDELIAPSKHRSKKILSVGEGKHYFFRRFRPFCVERTVEQRAGASWGDINEIIKIVSLGRSQAPIRKLIEEIMVASESATKKLTSIYVWDNTWSLFSRQLPRKLDSVFLPNHAHELIVKTVQRFIDDREYYLSRGIPYRLGILFHGVPGSGKTSMINALAAHFERNIRLIDISNANNRELSRALSNEAQDSIVVIEDVNEYNGSDALRPPKQPPKGVPADIQSGSISLAINRLTLSGLLCAIDGATSSDGRILIMTTNTDITVLPPELMRPGRVDLVVEFTPMNNEEAIRMMEYLYQDKDYRVPTGFRIRDGISAAQLQGLILANRDCPFKVLMEVGAK